MMEDFPASPFFPEQGWRDNLPCILIFASCHGRTLLDYFSMQPAFRSKYNIMRLETGPIRIREHRGADMMNRPAMKLAFKSADILLTNNMGPRHLSHSLNRVIPMLRSDCRIITWTAPNFSAFWPISEGYCGAIAVLEALDRGKSVNQICQDFEQAQFDPLFNLRWRIEMGRISDRDNTHDVKLGDFIQRNFRTHKLFMGASHPSFLPMAHMGAQIIRMLGHECDSEEQVLAYDYNIGTMAGEPETGYEFKHYGFTYPMRHLTTSVGGLERYIGMIHSAAQFWTTGGYCTIPPD